MAEDSTAASKYNSSSFDVWRLLELSLAEQPPAATPTPGAQPPSESRKLPSQSTFRRLDWIGAVFWTYVVVKVFLADVDRLLLEVVAPWSVEWLNLRIVLYVALVVLFAIVFRGRWWMLLYIAAYPLVVLFWKIPAVLIRYRSWPLFFGVMQAGHGFFGSFRYNVVTKGIALIAMILIIVSNWAPLLLLAAAYLLWHLGAAYIRLLQRIFSAQSFASVQRDAIVRVVSSPAVETATLLKDEYKRTDLDKYDSASAQQVVLAISLGIIVNRALYLWAYELDRYQRRFAPSLGFAVVSLVSLYVGTIFTFAFVNEALLQVSPEQYAFASDPTLIAVMAYSAATLFFSAGGGIIPVGDLALIFQLLAGSANLFVLTSFAVHGFLSWRRERDDTATDELVSDLKQRARDHEIRFQAEYKVSVEEAQRRLEAIGASFASIVAFVAARVPDNFIRPEGASARERN